MADYSREENLADAGKLAAHAADHCHLPAPTIARVQGDVLRRGMGLVAACDMAVAVEERALLPVGSQDGLDPRHHRPLRAAGHRARAPGSATF